VIPIILVVTILAFTVLKIAFLCRVDLRTDAGSIIIFLKGVFSMFSKIVFISFISAISVSFIFGIFSIISVISVNIISVVISSERLRIFIEIAISISLNIIFLNIRIIRLIEFHNLYIIFVLYSNSHNFSNLTASLSVFLI
jgi:hypothetical protein